VHTFQALLHATNEGQLQDRLASAIDHMGAEDSDGDRLIDVRVGGIYQLGRFGLAGANARVDAAAILTAYVRDNAPVQTTAVTPMSEVANCGPPRTSVAADITAVLEQLRRLYPVDEDRPPDRGLDLSNSDLSDADLEGIDLRNANLSNARLIDANLINVDLREARLTHVDARFACFGLAKLARANFDSAGQADEQRLREEASNLEHAQFNSADLTAVEMSYADLRGATMVDANVDRADFSGADSSGLRWQSNHGVPRFCPPLAAGCRDAR
jgi:hypothetical protein